MNKLSSAAYVKVIVSALLVLSLLGFFYFEPSATLRILAILFGCLGLWQLTRAPEIVALLVLYLGIYDLYNLHYGFSVPLSVLMILVFGLSMYLFFAQVRLANSHNLLSKNTFNVFSWVTSLAILEFFAVMNFWPVDPRTKALIATVTFFLFGRIFYLYSNNMLSFRRAMGYVIACVIIFSIIIFLNLKFGL